MSPTAEKMETISFLPKHETRAAELAVPSHKPCIVKIKREPLTPHTGCSVWADTPETILSEAYSSQPVSFALKKVATDEN